MSIDIEWWIHFDKSYAWGACSYDFNGHSPQSIKASNDVKALAFILSMFMVVHGSNCPWMEQKCVKLRCKGTHDVLKIISKPVPEVVRQQRVNALVPSTYNSYINRSKVSQADPNRKYKQVLGSNILVKSGSSAYLWMQNKLARWHVYCQWAKYTRGSGIYDSQRFGQGKMDFSVFTIQ